MNKFSYWLCIVGLFLFSGMSQARERVLSINISGWSSGEYNFSYQLPLNDITGYAIFTSYAKSFVPDYVNLLTGGNAIAPVFTFAPDYRRYLGDYLYVGLGAWIFIDSNKTYTAFNGSTGYELPLSSNMVFSLYARYNISPYSQSLFYGSSIGFYL